MKKGNFYNKIWLIFLIAASLVLGACGSVTAIITEGTEGSDEAFSSLPGLPALPEGAAERIRERRAALEEIQANLLERRQAIAEKHSDAAQRRQAFVNRHREYDAFREQLRMRREESLFLMRQNRLLQADNMRLRANLKAALASLREQGTELPEDIAYALKLYSEELRQILDQIRLTDGEIRNVLEANKGFIRDKDYVRMEIAFDEITAIQQYRNQSLRQINEILKSMLQMIIAQA